MAGSTAGFDVQTVTSFGGLGEVTERSEMAGLAEAEKLCPCTGVEGQTLDGIGVVFGHLPKKVSNDPSFFFFASLSRLSCVSLQIFFP